MTRPIPRLFPPPEELPRREHLRADTEPSPPPSEMQRPPRSAAPPVPKLPRATDPPHMRGAGDPPHGPPSVPQHATPPGLPHGPGKLPFVRQEIVSASDPRSEAPTKPPRGAVPPQRLGKLPFARQEIVAAVDERSHTPAKLPRATTELSGPPELPVLPPPPHTPHATPTLHPPHAAMHALHLHALQLSPASPPTRDVPTRELPPNAGRELPTHAPHGHAPHAPHLGLPVLPETARTESAQLPAVDLDLASSRIRPRGTPNLKVPPNESIRTLVFAPDPARAAWIERELSHAPITIQVGRRARTIVAALTRDPPPRPDVLVVDFDAIAPSDVEELQALRRDGWFGRLIGMGDVSPELRISLGIDEVLPEPLVRDSLLDCVAGTRHAAVTTACPVLPNWDDHS